MVFFIETVVGTLLCLGGCLWFFARHGVGAAGRFLVLRVDAVDAENFFRHRACFSTSVQMELPLHPPTVWQALLKDDFLSWLPGLRGYQYRPVIGTKARQRTFVSFLWAGEEQLVWVEPHKVLMSSMIAASAPGVRHLLHRYELSETVRGGTVLTWTLGLSPVLGTGISLRWLAPVVRPWMRLVLSGIATRL